MFRIVRSTLSLTVLAVSTFLVAAEPTPRPMPSVAAKPSFSPQSLAYVLQADKLARPKAAAVKRLAGCNRDLVVLDASYNTEPNGKWTTADIIPQNASQLLADPQYLKTIDAIGVEDLFTNGNKKQPPKRFRRGLETFRPPEKRASQCWPSNMAHNQPLVLHRNKGHANTA